MSRRNMVLVGLVGAMLAVVAVGYCMHEKSAVTTPADQSAQP
jgi:hypothetical protein